MFRSRRPLLLTSRHSYSCQSDSATLRHSTDRDTHVTYVSCPPHTIPRPSHHSPQRLHSDDSLHSTSFTPIAALLLNTHNDFQLRATTLSQHEHETLTDAWLRMNEMLRNCHSHNLSKGNIIKIFYYGLNKTTQEALNAAAGGIFLYKTPNQAYQLPEDKVLLKLDWAKNQKPKPSLKKTIAFVDEGSSNSNTDKIMTRMDAMTLKMDAQYK
ncbi:hypothetical protein Tco_1102923 [Tanacetum coccineum]